MDSYLEMICSTFKVEPGLVFLNAYKKNLEEADTHFFSSCNLDINGKVVVESIPERVKFFCKEMCHSKDILIRKFRKGAIEMDPLLEHVMKDLKIKDAGKIFLLAHEYVEEMASHEDIEDIFFSFSTLNQSGIIVQPEIPEEVATYCQALLDKKVEYAFKPIKKNEIKDLKISLKNKKKTKSKWKFE